MTIGALARKAGAVAGVAVGAGALVFGAAVPGYAADEAQGGAAMASALEAKVAGQVVSEPFSAAFEGSAEVTNGINTPEVPEIVTGGLLSQDAVGNEYFSAACAGLVGAGGKVSLDAKGTCMVDGNAQVSVSLGTLTGLGVKDILGKLPKLPDVADVPDLTDILDGLPLDLLGGADDPLAALPNVELRIVGQGLTARCTAEASSMSGYSTTAHAKLVAVVDGQQVALGEITKQGLSLSYEELLTKVMSVVPADAQSLLGEVTSVLDQLPVSQLTEQVPALEDVVSIRSDVRNQTAANIQVTALEANLAAPALPTLPAGLPTGAVTDKLPGVDLTSAASLKIGSVNCAAPGYGISVQNGEQATDGQTLPKPGGRTNGGGTNGGGDLGLGGLGQVTGQVEQLLGTAKSLLNVF